MNKKKILVVDDDKAIVILLHTILEDAGYEVSHSINTEEILSMKKDLPDLMLLDFSLLAMDGWDICSILKAREPTNRIPILMISAHKDTSEIAQKAGADGYITKPFEIQFLLDKVKQHILA